MSPEAKPEAPVPPVSVVIPAYNRASTIGAAIDSVLRQTYPDFELVVVDDGSTDGTLEAARAITDPRLRVIAAPHNMGAAGARNLGVAEARGTWIAFQDSDDEWLPEKLAKQMARLAIPAAPSTTRSTGGNIDWVACYCGLLTVGALNARPSERTTLRYVPDSSIKPTEGDILEPLLGRNMISTQTLVVRRDVFLALGCFDDTTTPIEDWDFALRLTRRGPIAFVDEPLVHQRFSPDSITRWTRRRLESRARLVAKNIDLFASHPHRLAWQYYILASDNRKAGDLAAARRYLALARKTQPASPRPWAMSLYVAGLSLIAPFHSPPKPDQPAG